MREHRARSRQSIEAGSNEICFNKLTFACEAPTSGNAAGCAEERDSESEQGKRWRRWVPLEQIKNDASAKECEVDDGVFVDLVKLSTKISLLVRQDRVGSGL